MSANIVDEVTRILERAKHEALMLISSLPTAQERASEALPEWMTEEELARYWRILKDNEPVTAGIVSWTNRAPDEYPLPCARMGEMRRYHRETADRWVWEEAERQRVRRAQKKLHEMKRA
jgi:hypothetical protein